jgi:uncharacterized DUF497 family protein
MELGDLRVTYVGGPTALFEIERLRLLTDPTFDPAGDPRKAEANAAKHGVSFEDAVTVFLDPEAFDGPDRQHSSAESRFLRLGRSAGGHVLMVAYTFRRSGDAEAIRIISARRASRRERAAYAATD